LHSSARPGSGQGISTARLEPSASKP
jgi:hypothetical protein